MVSRKKNIIDKSVGEILQVNCITCKNTTRHKVLTSVDASGNELLGGDEYIYWDSNYQIIECQGCEDISFRSTHSNSEEYGPDGPIKDILLYPSRTDNLRNARDLLNIPFVLERFYFETINCFNSGNLTLCGAGVRALVEGICNEQGVKKGEAEITKKGGKKEVERVGSLEGKINGLFEKGILTKRNADILHEHRYLGNTSIHTLSAPTKVELILAIDIIEHIFETLYEIPGKAMELKYRRLKKKK